MFMVRPVTGGFEVVETQMHGLDDARARDEGGSGLGLAIARELIRRNGGDIRLADAAPGVRAVVTVPAAPPPSRAIH
jgi:signal transduction histidine kinase